ncbi:4Fe-4S dicluster domain-containing protein [bacterium]|nr:4Fe-4S dicluster domain-containing protein [bacterium]
MAFKYLSKNGLKELLHKLDDWGDLFWVDGSVEGKPRLSRATKKGIDEYRLPLFRGVEPLKSLIMPPKQKVGEYPGNLEKDIEVAHKKRAIFGITQCDLAGIKVYDRVFRDDPDFLDPFYIERREGLFIVTIDCCDVHPSCFCNLVKGKPYCDTGSGFDLNLTHVENGFLVEIGSDAGEQILKGTGASEATDSLKADRDKTRARTMKKLEEQNAQFVTEKTFIELVSEAKDEPESYRHHGSTCVECGACTNVCPACFCFSIYDNSVDGERYERLMTWDSCQLAGFSRMAGMLNPRLRVAQRFMHRYNHKFFHYPWRYDGWPSCTGCGRCIDNCMGNIDMRATLRDLSVDSVADMLPSPSPKNHAERVAGK